MFVEAQTRKLRGGVDGFDLCEGEPVVEVKQHGDEPLHDHRIRGALKGEFARFHRWHEPNLRGAALDLCRGHAQSFVQRRK